MKVKDLIPLFSPNTKVYLIDVGKDEKRVLDGYYPAIQKMIYEDYNNYDVEKIQHEKTGTILKIKKPFNKEEWVKERYYGYQNAPKIVSRTVGSTTYVLNPDEPWKYGWSKRKPTDKDNAQVAIAVAYARYLGEKIPKEI